MLLSLRVNAPQGADRVYSRVPRKDPRLQGTPYTGQENDPSGAGSGLMSVPLALPLIYGHRKEGGAHRERLQGAPFGPGSAPGARPRTI